MTDLPIEPAITPLRAALRDAGAAVLQAPPGAGKTTRVPLALLDEPWLAGGKIVMLEPRRLAARAAARRMAEMLGESVGETVGHRVRLDVRVGPRTRIEVVTEGILGRMIQDDPGLAGIGLVIFDEYHERSLDADLALALCLEARAAVREDLKLLVMSATLDGAPVARLLGEAPAVTSEGRSFPVETHYLERPPPGRIEDATSGAVRRALQDEAGDVLVFLPGAGEIRRVAEQLADLPGTVDVLPLYGDLGQAEQDRAIRPSAAGRRKVVLATSIAETSLTIEGVRVVVDSGLRRTPRFDPRSGMTRLETVRVSRAGADQRRGRAGRTGPGTCLRLWTEPAQSALAAFETPEILEADLAPLALALAAWGTADPAQLAWLDPPPAAAYQQARDLLTRLGALDGQGRITAHGKAMAGFGMHPRLAHMVLEGRRLGHGGLAADLAAVLGERDLLRAAPGGRDADIALRLMALRGDRDLPGGLRPDRGALARAREAARQWRRQLRVQAGDDDLRATGILTALAYPDRIAQRRPGGEGQFRLSNGRGAVLPPTEPLSASDWLAIANLDGDARAARVFLAAAVDRTEIEGVFAAQIENHAFVSWDGREEAVLARRQRRLGALVLEDAAADVPPERLAAAMVEGVRAMGLACLPWTPEIEAWRARIGFLRRVLGNAWPDLSDAALSAGLDEWLAPHLDGMQRRAHLRRLDLARILRGLLDFDQQRRLDGLAPTHLAVPSGSRIALDYGEDPPVLAVKLQEMFGATETPLVAGRIPVKLHLLSPAGRPLAVTQDLASFWAGAYGQVKRDMRGQYPKHPWPDDPLAALPTAKTKRRLGL